jgi:hypothetical protein
MRQKQTPQMTAMRRATARGTALAGLLLLLTFVAHHGIAAASDHPLDVLASHSHSDHHDASHDHDPHADPVGHPKRTPRWVTGSPLPDASATPHAVVLQLVAVAPAPGDVAPAESPPVLAGADRRALFQVFRI